MNPNLNSISLAMSKNFNTLRSRQNGQHFADGIFKCIFRDWKSIIFKYNFIEICSLGCNEVALVQIMAWRRITMHYSAAKVLIRCYQCHKPVPSLTNQIYTHKLHFNSSFPGPGGSLSSTNRYNSDGLVQHCSSSSANVLEILQSCTEWSI